MPMPVSFTCIVTFSSSQSAETVTEPVSVYLMALSTRMISICSTRSALAYTGGAWVKSVSTRSSRPCSLAMVT